MARRGGFNGGAIPGNMSNMLKQAQRMQRQMEEAQKTIEEKEFSASAGGGAVEATVTGKKVLTKLTISKDAVDPDDVEMLQDMVMAAINEALAQAETANDELMRGISSGLNLSGLPF
ncbi:MAG: YbaB/EbfC family nucleoid-associated protein [Lachnospiraceae bacterium]|nr:YbaB/EbfC family nucleoid-associated protein [Lachnospiraceae bacterium]MBR0515475.1 YbaB/EbfC family nucleoid-associated protein [Eubacterium sp.]MCR5391555.1 YbaB/EbfC family nucleoid-associated protein [Lachnospiraceae bacterium]